jgi:hypothetical protein
MGQFILPRDADDIFETKSSPQENQRLAVPRAFLEVGIEEIKTHVQNACAELVFNLDEIGISESEDRIERKVSVPSTMRDEKIFHGIHRGLKHISVAACISASGDHIISFVISSQVSDAVVWKLKIDGFRIRTQIILKKREKPYINAELCHEYILTILLQHIVKIRSNLGLTDGPTVLLMDNCSVYIQESTLRNLAAGRAKVVTFPPHTTNIFQGLDLILFGILKKRINYKLPLDSDDSMALFIKRIFTT